MNTNIPIVFIVFNRPDTTAKVFEAIRQAKPNQLFIIADGPRQEFPNEPKKCDAVRSIFDKIDWKCELVKNYSDSNLGCKLRVYTGLDWVFSQVEEAIILEDDCLPHFTFFPFCEELLKYYRYDSRIAVISGQNVQLGKQRTDYSYYFSHYNHCWGWATWKRAWQNFDYDMKLWPLIRDNNWLEDIFYNKRDVKYWTKIFQDTFDGKIDSWAYRWNLSCWINNQSSILSNVNLISNIGFGNEGTNTKTSTSIFANMPTEKMDFPLKHPPFMIKDTKSDQFTQDNLYNPSLINRIKRKIKHL
jgi:hypothetical protein